MTEKELKKYKSLEFVKITHPELQGRIEVHQKGLNYNLIYLTDDIEVLTRTGLQKLAEDIGVITAESVTLFTNAGVDLHSSESSLYGITVKKVQIDYDY